MAALFPLVTFPTLEEISEHVMQYVIDHVLKGVAVQRIARASCSTFNAFQLTAWTIHCMASI